MTESVPFSSIRADIQAQPRTTINTEVVGEYAEAMLLGAQFPPLIVFQEGDAFWLADGFHRFYAATGCDRATVECDVRPGGLRDAILFSVGANAAHGQRRTNEDKRRAVLKLLDDPEWKRWSDREIARQCGVDGKTVTSLRPAPLVTAEIRSEPRTYTTKHGTVAQMNTAAIGRREPVAEREPWTPADITAAPSKPDSFQQAREFFQQGNEDFFHHLGEIERRWQKLPSPEEVERDFPPSVRHAFTADRLAEIANWFSSLSKLWLEKSRVAAE